MIRHTVAGTGWTESQRAADEIEQVRLPECCGVQFDHDQIALCRYLTDRMSRCLLPGVRGRGIQHQSTQQDNCAPRDTVHAVRHSAPLLETEVRIPGHSSPRQSNRRRSQTLLATGVETGLADLETGGSSDPWKLLWGLEPA